MNMPATILNDSIGIDSLNAPSGLKAIWEIDPHYRCPLIGASLNEEDHKRMLKKAGFKIKGMKLHQIHAVIMRHLGEKNRVSSKVDNFLKQKFRDFTDACSNLQESEFEKRWNQAVQEGDFAGLIYIASARRDLSDDLLNEIFGDLHMMSHTGVHELSTVKRDLKNQKEQNQQLSQKVKQHQSLNRDLTKENDLLKRKIQELENTLAESADVQKERVVEVVVNEEEVNDRSSQKYLNLKEHHDQIKIDLQKANTEIDILTDQLNETKALNEHLQGDIEDLISHFSKITEKELEADINDLANRTDLESKRVLIVGGMTKIKHLYQHMIEANGGKFEYHDGRVKNGNQTLDAKVNRSDIIICPVNCNSHNACNRVKKLCQKYNKPLKMLSNASVSTISTALMTPEASMNAQFL